MVDEAWSEDELRASVEAYADMYIADTEGRRVNKAQVYRDLEARFGRRNKAFERRMMNISNVVKQLGGTPVKGLLPAANIGASTEPKLRAMVIENGFLTDGGMVQPPTTVETNAELLDQKVSDLAVVWKKSGSVVAQPSGLNTPRRQVSTSAVFERSPEVKAWVLVESGYCCESCGEAAPFVKDDGVPYLEVHHVVTLADGGPDTVCNTVAVCPDCHRALHYAADRVERVDKLYAHLPRLKRPH